MMETNPQSNAAPPASEDAIGKLQRKAVDDDMLGPEGTAECTICIDELKKGEEVVGEGERAAKEACAKTW
ncbi:hypothetical protein ACHAQF_000165 [Verticillium nonalfalfae]